VLGAVDGRLGQVEADDLVVDGQGRLGQGLEDAGLLPLV
jgi:hypothetical protein